MQNLEARAFQRNQAVDPFLNDVAVNRHQHVTDKVGNHVFRAEMLCESPHMMLAAEEATHFYGDDAPARAPAESQSSDEAAAADEAPSEDAAPAAEGEGYDLEAAPGN